MAGQKEGTGDSTIALLVMGGILVCLGVYVAWAHLFTVMLWIARVESWLLWPFMWVGSQLSDTVAADWARWLAFLEKPTIKLETSTHLWGLADVAGRYFRWHVVMIVAAFCTWAFWSNKVWAWRRKMSLEDLIGYNGRVWPRMRVVARLSAKLGDLERGPWRAAEHPHEWAKRVGALNIGTTTNRQGEEEFVQQEGEFLPEKAYAGFAAQLGPLWKGSFDDRPFHERVLAAVFMARVLDRRDDAVWLLDEVGGGARWDKAQPKRIGFAVGERVPARVQEILAVGYKDRELQALLACHAHVYNVLAALLDKAREKYGSLATADFRWLKVCDRTLFYCLNSIGRRVAWVEAAGLRAHAVVERERGEPMITPAVVSAVTALHDSLWGDGWVSDTHAEVVEGENLRVFSASEPVFDGFFGSK